MGSFNSFGQCLIVVACLCVVFVDLFTHFGFVLGCLRGVSAFMVYLVA